MLFFPEVFRNENQKRFSGFPRGFSVYNTDYDGISRVVRGIRRFNAVKVLFAYLGAAHKHARIRRKYAVCGGQSFYGSV